MFNPDAIRTPEQSAAENMGAQNFGRGLENVARNFPLAGIAAGILAVEGIKRMVFGQQGKGK
jgi:hypothetical protein